jgi:hypothetical protein
MRSQIRYQHEIYEVVCTPSDFDTCLSLQDRVSWQSIHLLCLWPWLTSNFPLKQILSPDQTGIMDRYYQRHKNIDQWQQERKHFVCRIRANTKKTLIRTNEAKPDSIVFYDAIVLLGTTGVNQTEKELRVVGYKVDGVNYWIAPTAMILQPSILPWSMNSAGT